MSNLKLYGSNITDVDGNQYTYVTIGNQQWMVQNLKVTHYSDDTSVGNYGDNPSLGLMCWPNNDAANKEPYGGLYNYYAIDPSRSPTLIYFKKGRIQDTGWHIPTYSEVQTLIDTLGWSGAVGGYLKETGTDHWLTPNTDANNSSRLTFVGAGDTPNANPAQSEYFKEFMDMWTSTPETPGASNYVWYVRYDSAAITDGVELFTDCCTVRCMRNVPTSYPILLNKLKLSGNPIVYDIDKNQYTYVTIGTQQWMVQNLKTTKYVDGTPVLKLESSAAWVVDTSGAYCEYDNSTGIYMNTYGYLYNGYAVNSSHGLAPVGWRIPTYNDASLLSVFLGGEASAGGKLKEVGLTHWQAPNTGATDDYGFKGLPAGARSDNGVYTQLGGTTNIWDGSTHDFQLHSALTSMVIYIHNSSYGFSVRCMRDLSIGSYSGSFLNKLKLLYHK